MNKKNKTKPNSIMPNMSIAQENLTLPKGNSPSPVQPDKPQRIDVPN